MKKKSFVFNVEWQEILLGYPSEVRLEVYDAIIEYVASGTILELKPMAKMAFSFIKKEIDYNTCKYNDIVAKRSEAGKKAMNKRYNQDVTNLTNDSKSNKCYQDVTNLTVNENDNDIDKESPNGDKKAIPKSKDFDLSFVSEEFKDVFKEWLEYKRERKENYKSDKSLKTCYNRLLTLSGNDCDKAKLVVEQSIASNYAGLFELKSYGTKQHTDSYEQKRIDSERRKSQLMVEFAEADAKFLAEQEAKRKAVGSIGEISDTIPNGG